MKQFAWKSILLLVLSFMLILTGCGNSSNQSSATATNDNSSKSTSTPAPAEKDVNLKIINFRVEDKAFYDQINAEFEKKYPYIHIKYDVVPTKDYSQLRTARASSDDIDLFAQGGESDIKDPTLRSMMADMSTEPLYKEVTKNYIPDALKAGQLDGKQYFLPISSIALVTFYNKKIFADLGLQVPKTWDEFVKVSEAIKASKVADPILFGGKDQWPINMIIDELEGGVVRGSDPNFYSKMRTGETKFTDPRWLEVYQKLAVLSKYFQKNATGLDYGQAPGLFAQGKAAMMIDGSWSLAQIEDAKPNFGVGTFLLPGSNNPEYNSVASTKFGFGWCLYKYSKNKDAAMKYLQFLTTPENYQKYNDMVRMLPVLQNVKAGSPIVQQISGLLQKQMPIWEGLIIPGAKYNYTQYGIQVILGELTPEKAVQKMQDDLMGSKSDWKQ